VISRHWKGIAKPGQAEAYVQHLKTDTFPKLSRIPGFIRASILSPPRRGWTAPGPPTAPSTMRAT
jgi:hypothetical protein